MSSNGSIITSGANIPASQIAADINGELAELYKRAPMLLGSVSAGPNAITAAGSPTLTALADGMSFWLVPQANNTGAVTLNIDGLGALPVRSAAGNNLLADALVADVPVKLVHMDGVFHVVGASSGGAGSPATPDALEIETVPTTSGATATSATIDVATLKAAGYRSLVVMLNGVSQTVTGQVYVKLSADNGANYTPAIGTFRGYQIEAINGSLTYSGISVGLRTNTAITAGETVSGGFTISDFAQTDTAFGKKIDMATKGSGTSDEMLGTVYLTGLGAINRIQVAALSGNLDAGSFTIFAV